MRNEELMNKWKPILEHTALPGIQDSHRAAVTATLLENTETSMAEEGGPSSLLEAAPANSTADMTSYNPVLISLVRRAMPNLVAYDIAGVQPMTGPTGLIFAMRTKYEDTGGKPEAFYGEADTDYSGAGTHANALGATSETTGTGLATADAEALGDGTAAEFAQMSFAIEKVSVTAKSRALKAEYTTELAQDLKAIHGLDAETELANMLSAELLAEINREVIRTVYTNAKAGSQTGTASAGTFNLDVDANGRWSVEKFKGLMFQIEKEANQIAKDTRRGKGNLIVCSSDVASALQMAGVLDYAPALNSNNLSPDDTGNTFAGVLNGRFKVYIDPYAGANYMVVGYKGSSTFDAGLFYCPYVPLQMVRAVGENSFQSKLGFKTRYGMVSNPYAQGATAGNGALTANTNIYYRRTAVSNLL
jgi:hypothetical protein|tara:strand:- start:36 stop:1292 length:1257 start_codon:yes stop_codon:yes gene_type:complete